MRICSTMNRKAAKNLDRNFYSRSRYWESDRLQRGHISCSLRERQPQRTQRTQSFRIDWIEPQSPINISVIYVFYAVKS